MIESFLKPNTIQDALNLKEEFKNRAIYYAGGTEINSTDLSKSYTHMISTEDLGFNQITINQGELIIGSSVTFQQLIDSDKTPIFLKNVSQVMSNRNIRNMATIGGNIAVNRSCSLLLPLLMVLNTQINTISLDGEEILGLEEYLISNSKELITSISIPLNHIRSIKTKQFCRTANDIAILNVAVSLIRDDQCITNLLVSVGGVEEHVVRLHKLEEILNNHPLPEKSEIENLVTDMITPLDDHRGSAIFKTYLTGVLVSDLIYNCFNEEVI